MSNGESLSPVKIVNLNELNDDYDSTWLGESKFSFNSKALEQIVTSPKAIEEDYLTLPVAVVSIAGDYRKGKSFLLNFFVRYLQRYDQDDWLGDPNEPLKGFKWRSGCKRETTGIDMWPEPFILTRKDGSKIAVLLCDTQGLFDDETEHDVVEQFYAISTLTSSIQIYNQMDDLKTTDITNLSKFSDYGRELSERTGQKAFQKLLLLVRDWSNVNDHEYGFKGGETYLTDKRKKQNNTFSDQWNILNECYSEIGCFLMPRIGDKAEKAEFNGEINQLKPEFVDHLKILIPSLLSPENIVVKSSDGHDLQLWEVFNNLKRLCSQLNVDSRINKDCLVKSKAENAFFLAREIYFKMLDKEPSDFEGLEEQLTLAEGKALACFEEKAKNVDKRFVDAERRNLKNFFAQAKKNQLEENSTNETDDHEDPEMKSKAKKVKRIFIEYAKLLITPNNLLLCLQLVMPFIPFSKLSPLLKPLLFRR